MPVNTVIQFYAVCKLSKQFLFARLFCCEFEMIKVLGIYGYMITKLISAINEQPVCAGVCKRSAEPIRMIRIY